MKEYNIYQLTIIGRKKTNTKKIVLLILLTVILVILCTFLGMDIAGIEARKVYAVQIDEEYKEIQEIIRLENIRKEEIRKRMEKVSKPLTEEQIDNIVHIYRSNGEKRVFLTFDDGPSELVTPLILDVLKKNDIKATFFVLGGNVRRYPSLIAREFNEGHYIASHGYTHRYADIYSSPEATLDDYNYCQDAIRDALSNPNYYCNVYRFPGGSNGGFYNSKKQNSKALLRENGIAHLDWNALTNDAAGANTKEELLQNAIDTVGDKDTVVILMHDASDKILTYETLQDLIDYLKEQGFVFKTIYDVI